MTDLEQEVFTDPVLEMITLHVASASVARNIVRQVAAAELGVSTASWGIRAVPYFSAPAFDVILPREHSLSVGASWQLVHALRRRLGNEAVSPSFEHNLDNIEEAVSATAGPPNNTGVIGNPDEPDFAPKMIGALDAHTLSRGADILVAHPDSGYREHAELFDPGAEPSARRLRVDLAWDFVDGDANSETFDVTHGLSTASVLMSLDNAGNKVVHGVAPEAQLIPLRVAKKRFLVPIPVLFRSGANRLRDAIRYAVKTNCHVVSISLGWLGNDELHRAVREAYEANIILCAAAGNLVRLVVWPARYPEVIAVAGCTADRRRWSGSCRGKTVDITAPAKDVWRATYEDDEPDVLQSSGTSYGAAMVAGVAALWLAHHGRDSLIARYPRHKLADVFRLVLAKSCDPPPVDHDDQFGKGIVNAFRALDAAMLPAEAELDADLGLRSADPDLSPTFRHFALDNLRSMSPEKTFDALRRLPAGSFDSLAEEATFHLYTSPEMRRGAQKVSIRSLAGGSGLDVASLATERVSASLRATARQLTWAGI